MLYRESYGYQEFKKLIFIIGKGFIAFPNILRDSLLHMFEVYGFRLRDISKQSFRTHPPLLSIKNR